eukprot:snap_masked-scaffold_59-processed-gene-0.87-mRNA-1 protein AED:1.00 eAED:1.00 QI:0/0/0/0/1/1/2/0/71
MALQGIKELFICEKGELPVNLEKGNFGKEILMAPSTWTFRKPKEIYELIEGCFNAKFCCAGKTFCGKDGCQ